MQGGKERDGGGHDDGQPELSGQSGRGPMPAWTAFVAILATIGILLIAPRVAVAAARGYGWLVGLGEARAYGPGEFDRLLVIHEAVYQATFDCALILLTVIASRVLSQKPAGFLALNAPDAGLHAYREAFLIVAVAATAWFGLAFALFPQDVANDIRPYRELMSREAGWVMPAIYCLLAPVGEELLFRGFLFRSLRESSVGLYPAAILTSAGWMLLHADRSMVGLAQIFALGLLFSFLLVRSGSLRVPIAAHIFFNAGLSLIILAAFPIV